MVRLICATVLTLAIIVIDFVANALDTADKGGWDNAAGVLLVGWVLVLTIDAFMDILAETKGDKS